MHVILVAHPRHDWVILCVHTNAHLCRIYLKYVGDNCVVMVVLFLVELLQVGGIIALTISRHLVPHLSLLSCLKEGEKKFIKSCTRTRKNHGKVSSFKSLCAI